MNTPVMFNRRLREQEIEEWLNITEKSNDAGHIKRTLAKSFLQLPETIAFISSINEEIIGGTSIYRDRIRLGMVLSSVAIKKEYRETCVYQVIKTSLPFMKTVAIRDVDALIAKKGSNKGFGFPASFELSKWLESTLEMIGFMPVGNIMSYTLQKNNDSISESNGKLWDPEPNLEGAKRLIWTQSRTTGLTTSLIWTALDFAFNRGSLRTLTLNGSTRIVTSIDRLTDIALIGLLVTNPEYSENSMLNHLVAELLRGPETCIALPLIGEGQAELVKLLANQLGASYRKQSLTLMRKRL